MLSCRFVKAEGFRKSLLEWYRRTARDLPWRRTRDPYRIWVSEVMLQQTRAEVVAAYYERFLARFPNVAALAAAGEDEVFALWAGLGYYSRARNLHRAARRIAAGGGAFPSRYAEIRDLPGAGDYTAAAVASIAFGVPEPALDGNVARVLSRLVEEKGDIKSAAVRARLKKAAGALLDRRRSGDFNQAMMELGATLCVPRKPVCGTCPVARFCRARGNGTARELPLKRNGAGAVRVGLTVLLIERRGRVLVSTTPGRPYWDLPRSEDLPGAVLSGTLGSVRHCIMNLRYAATVARAAIRTVPRGCRWIPRDELAEAPLSTLARKCLRAAGLRAFAEPRP